MNINKILKANPVNMERGAPMGARNFHESTVALHLQRVRFVDGDYGSDGTYWGGGGLPLWCAFNGSDDPEYAPAFGSRIYVRARNRSEAVKSIQQDYNVSFKR